MGHKLVEGQGEVQQMVGKLLPRQLSCLAEDVHGGLVAVALGQLVLDGELEQAVDKDGHFLPQILSAADHVTDGVPGELILVFLRK